MCWFILHTRAILSSAQRDGVRAPWKTNASKSLSKSSMAMECSMQWGKKTRSAIESYKELSISNIGKFSIFLTFCVCNNMLVTALNLNWVFNSAHLVWLLSTWLQYSKDQYLESLVYLQLCFGAGGARRKKRSLKNQTIYSSLLESERTS